MSEIYERSTKTPNYCIKKVIHNNEKYHILRNPTSGKARKFDCPPGLGGSKKRVSKKKSTTTKKKSTTTKKRVTKKKSTTRK